MLQKCSCDLDIGLASEVQQLLFPKGSPVCNWSCIGVKNLMANGLGGDYFDFITMPDDCQALFIGDVTGHGVHASVVMALLYGFIHHSSRGMCAPLDMVRQTNDFLQSFAVRSKEFDHFFSSTLFFGIIHPETLEMAYVNAGHPAPMVRRGSQVFSLPPSAPPLGFFDTPEITRQSFHLQRNDRLFLFTDGLTEAFNDEGKIFGRPRLEEVLRNHQGDHLEFLDAVFLALHQFGAIDPPGDDCTAIVLDLHAPV